ncbi:hypothetical protein PAE9249_02602 [Paenibacillus sp. CECT 9249]|uniref:helicase-associated domain-containing protein n=1 Tax=Paenibacillus sp. CECT 9249 TaxID=2845385 RepID=UPI001E3DC3D5|nr:helicase-associated domain-containing protein [Paenibacillus sp. CECT 9249]CAH0120089.1 hypothetical protein PAE9249_02602 [Paenibacillus sp. CECT 9249]
MNTNEIFRRFKRTAEGEEAQRFGGRPDASSAIAGLSPLELAALERIVKRHALAPFEMADLDKMADGRLSGAQIKVGWMRLRQKGLLYAVKKTWGERLFFIPIDLFPLLQREVAPLRLQPLDENEAGAANVVREAKRGLVYELFYTLSFTAKHGLPLTGKGTVHKRNIQKLSSELELSDRDVAPLRLAYAHAEIYSPAFVLVLDMALRLGLLRKESERFQLVFPRLNEWLHLPAERMQAELLRLFVERYTPREGWLQHLAYALCFGELTPGRWYRAEDAAEWIRLHEFGPQSELSREMTAETIWEGWLSVLCALGWIELGRGKEGDLLFRWICGTRFEADREYEADSLERMGDCAIGAHFRPSFYVQPDFEIIVPPDVPFAVRWELECCAKRLKSDIAVIYVLAKESFVHAVENGRSPHDIERLLGEWSAAGIPDNVLIALEQWKSQYGKVHFAETTLLRCEDGEVAAAIRNSSLLNGMLQPLGETDFIVAKERIEEIRPLLEQIGYTPKRQIAGEGALPAPSFPRLDSAPAANRLLDDGAWNGAGDDAGDFASQGIVYTGSSLVYYDLDMEIPDLNELFPKLETLPNMWTKQMRSYHASTRKEMMELAVEWQTQVVLQKDGQAMPFLPLRVQSTKEDWSVEGYWYGADDAGKQRLFPSDWEEMKLVVPGTDEKKFEQHPFS